ncbi:MAG: glucokinase [Acidobacteria bacterium]|nr:glucokinase [Acidobacteriota bacterium]
MILAGDVGGTKTILGVFDDSSDPMRLVDWKTFPSRKYPALENVITEFLQGTKQAITDACFGIAGPVRQGRVVTPNLPWIVESEKIAAVLKTRTAILINDLEATAFGIATVSAHSLLCLNQGSRAEGNQAIIAAGTGLGEAFLYWDGKDHLPSPSEGGHAEFGPRTDLEVALLDHLRKKFGHVSYERILSGPGLVNIYGFLRDTGKQTEPEWLRERIRQQDAAAAISEAALQQRNELAMDALNLFVSIYGAEAGNLALKTLALGGVYIGGGIAPKIQTKLVDGVFMQAFTDKGRFEKYTRDIPVYVILDDKTTLKGAARCTGIRKTRETRQV